MAGPLKGTDKYNDSYFGWQLHVCINSGIGCNLLVSAGTEMANSPHCKFHPWSFVSLGAASVGLGVKSANNGHAVRNVPNRSADLFSATDTFGGGEGELPTLISPAQLRSPAFSL